MRAPASRPEHCPAGRALGPSAWRALAQQRTTRRPWRGTPMLAGHWQPVGGAATARRGTACACPALHGSRGHQGYWCCPPSAPSPAPHANALPAGRTALCHCWRRGWCRCPAVDGLLRRPFGHAGVQRRGAVFRHKSAALAKGGLQRRAFAGNAGGRGPGASSTQRSRAAISVG